MRVISGKFKNKKLFFPKNFRTRPLKDSVKENIFNILEHSNKINIKFNESVILDLYSGSGSFGLEFLSRYKSEVYFVENNKDDIKSLEKNIQNLSLNNRVNLYEQDVFDFFKKLNSKKKFDIIFLDPPFADYKYKDVIKIIIEKKILNKNHLVVIHREKSALDSNIHDDLDIIENRVYGRSNIFFCKFLS